MIVDEHAEMDREALGVHGEPRAGREIDHPQVVDVRGLESFGRAVLEAPAAQRRRIVAVAAQEAVEGGQRRELAALLPARREHFQRDARVLLDLGEDPLAQTNRELAESAPVIAGFGLESGETSLFVGVPIVLQSAWREVLAPFVGPWAQRGLTQGIGKQNAFALLLFEEADCGETPKRHLVFI